MSDSTATPAVLGLRYIAGSPPEIHGGFHEETIAIAKSALEELAQSEKALAELRAIAEGLADQKSDYDTIDGVVAAALKRRETLQAFTEWKARNPE